MPHLYGDAGVLPSDRPDSPSKDQVSTLTNLTNLTNQQDYLFPTTSNESFLSQLHSADTMYAKSAYEWPYTSGLKTTDTSAWLDMSTPAAAGSWFSDMTAPAPMISYPAHYNPAEINYAQLSSSMVLPSTHSNPVLPETRYLQSIHESFKTSSVTPTNYASTATCSTTSTSTTPLTQPSRSKRNKGGSVCACPNCQEIDQIGPSAAHLKAKGPHSCHFPGCGKVYNRSSHLKAHIRWHTGDRQFVCNWLLCGKRFTRNDELQKHLQTHADEKIFTCPSCNKQFMKKDHLSKHIKTHEDGTLEPPTPSPPCTPSPSAADVANNNIDPSFVSKQKMMMTYANMDPTANNTNNHL